MFLAARLHQPEGEQHSVKATKDTHCLVRVLIVMVLLLIQCAARFNQFERAFQIINIGQIKLWRLDFRQWS